MFCVPSNHHTPSLLQKHGAIEQQHQSVNPNSLSEICFSFNSEIATVTNGRVQCERHLDKNTDSGFTAM